MNIDFWLARWTKNEIGFHQRTFNPYLATYWPALNISHDRIAFVPLCGKTLDMRWLSAIHPVLGIEVARTACVDFFREWDVTPQITQSKRFEHFTAQNVTLLCGDFFDLTTEDLVDVGGVFDRAALIALPPAMRSRYAEHLQTIVPVSAPTLLIAPAYAQHEMQGPPFSVDEPELRSLFNKRDVEVLASVEVTHEPENARFRQRGVTHLIERVCKIQ